MNKIFYTLFLFCFITCSDDEDQQGKSLAQEVAIIEMQNANINESFINRFSSMRIRSEYFTVIAPRSTENELSFILKQYIVEELFTEDFLEKNNEIKAIAGNTLSISKREDTLFINNIKVIEINNLGTAYLVVIDAFFD